ncbi:MAG: FHA domain-containing protein, partial [Hyphomicrobiaceae bacterium]|nr:FHA domain-containing protein [Hyphomicrobiaceae bacterium]
AAPAVVAAPRQVAAPVDHAEPVAHAEPASEEASGPEEGAAPDPATPTPPALMLPKAAALEIEAVEVETGEDEKAQEPAAGQKSDDELESMVDAEAALAVEGVAEEPVAPELSEEAAPPAQTEAPAGLPAAPSGTDTLIMDAASAGPVMDSAVLEGAAAWLDWIDPALEPSAIRRATTSVGRHESDDIVVSDPTVSRQHILLLELPTGGFEIINRQASRAKPNPIFINGEERATSALNDGDEVRLGRAGARFVFRIASRGAR